MNWRSFLRFALLPSSLVSAQVTIPKILSDHMVIQRDLPVHMWGRATPGEQVSVTFRGENEIVTTGRLGRWNVYLKPGAAGGPFEMTLKGIPAAVARGDRKSTRLNSSHT